MKMVPSYWWTRHGLEFFRVNTPFEISSIDEPISICDTICLDIRLGLPQNLLWERLGGSLFTVMQNMHPEDPFGWITRIRLAVSLISLAFFTLIIVSLLTVAFYRVYLHPLSRIPGPRFAAITNCWYAYQVRNGRMLRLGKTLHKQYGSAVRVGPNEVWFNTKDAFRLIYSKATNPSSL